MENKIEVGEYIRTKYGEIVKVIEYKDEIVLNKEIKFYGIYRDYLCEDELDFIAKHSFNIIDLIEVGDVIIGYTDISKYEVIGKNGEYIETLEDRYVTINDIKAILTKEMIEDISYKVERKGQMRDILQVGEYCRTPDGRIFKISEVETFSGCNYIPKDENKTLIVSVINKHSKNIIDLIEEGDYVNGSIVVEVLHGDSVIVENYGEEQIFENEIKSIVTKEHFEDIKYEV